MLSEKTTGRMTILENIPVTVNQNNVLQHLGLRNESERLKRNIQELVDVVIEVARPKALYKECKAKSGDGKIFIDNVEMISYVPTLIFFEGETIFPFVATCGLELDEINHITSDMMTYYSLNAIKEMILRTTLIFLQDHLVKKYEMAQLTSIGPGEALGPLYQQRKLFTILGNVKEKISVRLSDHDMMVPEKSSSGIYFETLIKLERCQLCPDTKCEGRKAPYHPDLLRKYRRVR